MRMFPNIRRPMVVEKLEHYWGVLCEKRGCTRDAVFFHVHKGGIRSLDLFGASSRDSSLHHLFFSVVLSFVMWDLT